MVGAGVGGGKGGRGKGGSRSYFGRNIEDKQPEAPDFQNLICTCLGKIGRNVQICDEKSAPRANMAKLAKSEASSLEN